MACVCLCVSVYVHLCVSVIYKWRIDLSIIRGAACNHVSQVDHALQNAEASYEVPLFCPLNRIPETLNPKPWCKNTRSTQHSQKDFLLTHARARTHAIPGEFAVNDESILYTHMPSIRAHTRIHTHTHAGRDGVDPGRMCHRGHTLGISCTLHAA